MAKVSVIIPSFNCAEYVAEAIQSVLAQTMQDFEVIVVDDGSTDHTRQVIERFANEPRVIYFYQQNRGLPGARNAGAGVSTAPYLAFLDADDTLAPDALEKMGDALERTGAGWCVIDLLKVRGNGNEIQRSEIPEKDKFYAILADDYIRRGMFFRREAFLAAGMYDEEMKNREDWDLNIRLLEFGQDFVYVPEPLYLYSWRDGSITTGSPAKMLFYTEKLLRKHHKRLADGGDRRAAKTYAANMWDLARRYFYSMRDVKKSLACCRESLAYDMNAGRVFHPVVHQFHRLFAGG